MKERATNPVTNLKAGTCIKGKWHKREYIIKKKLGTGAIGSVYLCDAGGKEFALKISDQSASITVEVNVLTSLKQVQGNRLGPHLLDVDDWVWTDGRAFSFYVMEYVKGVTMHDFIRKHGTSWVGIFMLQLLEDLGRLHQTGWIFGDLKLDNLLISSPPPRVRWVDVGGTTQKGRAIKEYTEFYDRGYWQLGTRRAEESYDLFALAMVFLHLFYPKQFKRHASPPLQQLYRKIDQVRELSPYQIVLKKAISGKYLTSVEMRRELITIISNAQTSVTRSRKVKKKQKSHVPFLIEIGGISFVACLYYFLSFWL